MSGIASQYPGRLALKVSHWTPAALAPTKEGQSRGELLKAPDQVEAACLTIN
jgi:hypothetical protein